MPAAPTELTRRVFLRGAATAAVLSVASAPAVHARGPRRRVAVFGGGMSGLVVAHELAERGFSVEVFESRPIMGGKSRSFGVPGTASEGRNELPAEHGFRFFPGFYRNVPDSMLRVPYPRNSDGVLGNLRDFGQLLGDDEGFGVAASAGAGMSFAGFVPYNAATMMPVEPGRLAQPDYLVEVVRQGVAHLFSIPIERFPAEMLDFSRKVAIYLASSDERRKQQWDSVAWWHFLDARNKSEYFRNVVARMSTTGLVAVKPEVASVSSVGNIIEAFLWNVLLPLPGPGDARLARFLDGPTSDAWITPWTTQLAQLGVQFHPSQALHRFEVAGDHISGARVIGVNGAVNVVDADFYVSAIPLDRATRILRTPELLRLDQSLEGIADLTVDWMNGLMIYLRQPLQVARGVFGIVDHPWTISAVSQRQLWTRDIAREFGDGSVSDIISVDISNWDGEGVTAIRKPAKHSSREEIFTEVWETLKARFAAFDPALADGNVHSWFLDPAITWGPAGVIHNDEPLTVQTVNSWHKRPKGPTRIPNLFIAGDWIQTNANVVSMEAANQAGRIVAQSVLDAAGYGAPVARFDYYVPDELAPVKRFDAELFRSGRPTIFGE